VDTVYIVVVVAAAAAERVDNIRTPQDPARNSLSHNLKLCRGREDRMVQTFTLFSDNVRPPDVILTWKITLGNIK